MFQLSKLLEPHLYLPRESMSQVLSKLDPKDNVEYGKETQRGKSKETVLTVIEQLHKVLSKSLYIKGIQYNSIARVFSQ